MELVGEGNLATLGNLYMLEGGLPVGTKAELRLYLRTAVSDTVVSTLQSQLVSKGVSLWDNVKQEGRTVYIRFVKGEGEEGIGNPVPPLLIIIAAIIIGLIALAILIIGWQLFREVSRALGPVLPIVVLGVAVVLLALMWGRRRK